MLTAVDATKLKPPPPDDNWTRTPKEEVTGATACVDRIHDCTIPEEADRIGRVLWALEILTSRPAEEVTGAKPAEVTVGKLTPVDPPPAITVTDSPPDVVAGAMPPDDPTRFIAVEALIVPPSTVTPRPPDDVTGAKPPEVPVTLTTVDPAAAPLRIVTPRPPDDVTGATPPASEGSAMTTFSRYWVVATMRDTSTRLPLESGGIWIYAI
jgi:hypothetical protein